MLMESKIQEKDSINDKIHQELQSKEYQCKQQQMEIEMLKKQIQENNSKKVTDRIKVHSANINIIKNI